MKPYDPAEYHAQFIRGESEAFMRAHGEMALRADDIEDQLTDYDYNYSEEMQVAAAKHFLRRMCSACLAIERARFPYQDRTIVNLALAVADTVLGRDSIPEKSREIAVNTNLKVAIGEINAVRFPDPDFTLLDKG